LKERKKIFLTVVVVSLLLFCGVHSLGAREAPVFQLPGLDGEIYSLSDFRGEPVVISFFRYLVCALSSGTSSFTKNIQGI